MDPTIYIIRPDGEHIWHGIRCTDVPVLTREGSAAHDLPAPVRAILIARSGIARHESRIAHVLQVVADELIDATELLHGPAHSVRSVHAAVLIAACLHGVGGHQGISGAATDRPEWASGFGSGRSHATDGPAWNAAIQQALDNIQRGPIEPEHVQAEVWHRVGTMHHLLSYCLHQAVEAEEDAGLSVRWIAAAQRVIDGLAREAREAWEAEGMYADMDGLWQTSAAWDHPADAMRVDGDARSVLDLIHAAVHSPWLADVRAAHALGARWGMQPSDAPLTEWESAGPTGVHRG